MSPALIAIVVFAVGALIVAIVYGRSAGALLAVEEGESVLIEEQPVRVESRSPVRTVVYGKCRVIVTDRRILISQKPLFGKEYSVPRYVITLSNGSEKMELAASLKQGAMEFSTSRSAISVSEKGGKEYVAIPVPASGLTRNQEVRIRTPQAQRLFAAVGGRVTEENS